MRLVIQRVSNASVDVNGSPYSSIGHGLLVLLGVEDGDEPDDIEWCSKKVLSMRIFADLAGKMNLNIKEAGGAMLIISQFTLHASTKKGNRPSFIRAARPEIAIPLYENFILRCKQEVEVKSGEFGADMDVKLVNDGPVTIILDSKNRE